MKVLCLIDCPLLLQSRVFLFRRAKTACRRRSGHASVIFYRQRHTWRPGVQKCGWCRTLVHFFQVGEYSIHVGPSTHFETEHDEMRADIWCLMHPKTSCRTRWASANTNTPPRTKLPIHRVLQSPIRIHLHRSSIIYTKYSEFGYSSSIAVLKLVAFFCYRLSPS